MMKALVFKGPGEMVIEDRPVRSPGTGEVLVRVAATGICGSDVHGFTGRSGRRHAGQVMGHETVGEVAELGSDTPSRLLGRIVAINPVLACGVCSACLADREQVCDDRRVLGVVPEIDAAFAEFVTVPASNVVVLPDGMPVLHGALVEPLAVGYHAVRRGRVQSDDRVLVIGGGPIGQAAGLAARRVGIEAVAISEPDATRREKITRLGMSALVTSEINDTVVPALGGRPTVVLDTVGSDASLRDGLSLSTRCARLILIGMESPNLCISSYALSVDERSIVGSFCYSELHFRETVEWAAANATAVGQMIDTSASLAEGPRLFTALSNEKLRAGKVLLCPDFDGPGDVEGGESWNS